MKQGKHIIVFTGPESTAKSAVSKQVADELGAMWVPEYAREYISALNRPYTSEDVETIARHQIEQYQQALCSNNQIIVFDTFLVITKGWFEIVYRQVPDWFLSFYNEVEIDLHLLCKPDIEWKADEVRENGHRRQELFNYYKNELETKHFNYQILEGAGEIRINTAINYIRQTINKPVNDR